MLNFHPEQFNMFKEMRDSDELAHAFLFTGAEGVGKLGFAREIAVWLQNPKEAGSDPASLGGHPDIIETPTPLPIDDAKALKKRLYTSPFSGKYKIVIIASAENMHPDAANSLLKILEEPRGDTIFMLCSPYPDLVLETIRSRCLEIKFNHVPDELIEKELDTKNIQDLKIHWSGRPAFAKKLVDDKKYFNRIKGYRDDWESFVKNSLSERFKISEKYAKIEDKRDVMDALRVWLESARADNTADGKVLNDILKVYQNTLTTNANVRYALNNLAIKYVK